MQSLEMLAQGFAVALTPTNLLFVTIGVVIGQIIGALPGIGPAAGMALLLPITYGIPPVTATVPGRIMRGRRTARALRVRDSARARTR